MTTETKPTTTRLFIAFDVALRVIRSLRLVVARLRKRSPELARQIERSASSVAANLAEGNRRTGKDRLHHFRVAAGSADETLAHLRVAEAWGWLSEDELAEPLALLDRQLRLIRGLTR